MDYLALSMRVHVLETRLLNRERIERMLTASAEEAAKVLPECGYGELTEVSAHALEQMLARSQAELFGDIGGAFRDLPIIDVFQSKYDYHNAKVLVKGAGLELPQEQIAPMLLGGGRYDPDRLMEEFHRDELRQYSEFFCRGIGRAREVLGSTGDPQLADFVLDRAYFEELSQLAQQAGSEFLRGYVAVCIDAANLRSAVRVSRLNKGQEFLRQVILPGGTVPEQALISARGEELGSLFRVGPLAEAAALGAERSAPGSGSLTEFECRCDDAVMEYLGSGRRVPFGEEPIIGYLYAREAEATAIRTIMNGKMAGIDGDTIRQRLRRTYA